MRNREQEVLRYLAILFTAFGGFGWLVNKEKYDELTFIIGVIVIIFLLFLGASYSLALGYNFRYVTLQIAKFCAMLQIKDAFLVGWPRTKQEFLCRYKLQSKSQSKQNQSESKDIPWCEPPELIKVFWWAFILGIAVISISGTVFEFSVIKFLFIIPIGGILIFLAWRILPKYYGGKLRILVEKEPDEWPPILKVDVSGENSKAG